MLIGYSNKKVEKICKDSRFAKKTLGDRIATKLYQRMEWLKAAETLDNFNTQYKFLRIHKLSGKYEGSYALDISERYRIIFYPCNENGEYSENDFKFISLITIEEVSNHYDD